MKKSILITLALASTFFLGFAFKSAITQKETTPKVTGIGGIFFKCRNPKKMTEWYHKNLGLNSNPYGGATIEWFENADSTKKGQTLWQPFPDSTTYFKPSNDFMIDYRVSDLDAIVEGFKKNGVTIVDTMEVVSYGKFIHVLDGEGNKVELWEPK